MKIKSIINIIALSLLIINCGEKKNNTKQENKKYQEKDIYINNENIISITNEQIKTIGIELEQIKIDNINSSLSVYGELHVPNNNKSKVSSMYSGVIEKLHIHLGEYVRKGQVIATISNPQFIQMQEEYLITKQKIILAEHELKRQEELQDGNAGILKNFQVTKVELNKLEIIKSSLAKQLKLMNLNPNSVIKSNFKSTINILSPSNGVISKLMATIGSYIDNTSAVAEIVDNNSLHLDLKVFEKDIDKIKLNQIINFSLVNNPNKNYHAKVFSIGNSFENESKSIPVHCDVIGDIKGLIDGMNITAIVSLNNTKSLIVPENSIINSDGKDYIFILKNKNTDNQKNMNFRKIEIIKGSTKIGLTAINPIEEIKDDAIVVTKNAYFINAKIVNSEGHEH